MLLTLAMMVAGVAILSQLPVLIQRVNLGTTTGKLKSKFRQATQSGLDQQQGDDLHSISPLASNELLAGIVIGSTFTAAVGALFVLYVEQARLLASIAGDSCLHFYAVARFFLLLKPVTAYQLRPWVMLYSMVFGFTREYGYGSMTVAARGSLQQDASGWDGCVGYSNGAARLAVLLASFPPRALTHSPAHRPPHLSPRQPQGVD
jgi:hypothetical protein